MPYYEIKLGMNERPGIESKWYLGSSIDYFESRRETISPQAYKFKYVRDE